MVLNTERVSVETGARLICDLVDNPEFRQSEAALAALRDKALEAHVRIKLRERFIPGTGVSNVDAAANGGRVVLTGVAIHGSLAADAGKLAAEVAGVKGGGEPHRRRPLAGRSPAIGRPSRTLEAPDPGSSRDRSRG